MREEGSFLVGEIEREEVRPAECFGESKTLYTTVGAGSFVDDQASELSLSIGSF